MSNKKKKPIYQEDYDDLINSRGNDSPLSAEAKKALGQPDKNISKNGEKKTDYNSVKDSQRNKENLNTLSSDTQEFTNSSGKNNRSGEQNGKAFSKKENPIKGSVEKNPLGGKDFEKTYEKLGVDFDKLYYESSTYLLGKDIIQKGVEKKVLQQTSPLTIMMALAPI